MTQSPQDLLEQWSPTGERMARRAGLWSAIQGGLLLVMIAVLFIEAMTNNRGTDTVSCFIIVIFITWGISLCTRGPQIAKRMRGVTIAVLVLSLILSLLFSLFVWITCDRIWGSGVSISKIDPQVWVILFFTIGISVSGFVAFWYCIRTLMHWPPRTGTAFQVELVWPPAESNGGESAKGSKRE